MPGFNISGLEKNSPSATAEPFFTYRWSIFFNEIQGLKNVVMYAMSCQRPSVEFDRTQMHNKQNHLNLPGKHKWNPIVVKFYEIVDISTPTEIFSYWTGSGAGGLLDLNTNTLRKKFSTKASIYLEDGQGSHVHTYSLYNVWPCKIDPSELDYTNSNVSTVSVTLSYDNADELADYDESGN